MFEDELFGHERGAFTGCIGRKQGLFELAHGGTLFLDEAGEIPLTMQAKLLRVLESGEYRRMGGTETLTADVRIVAATNRNLLDMAESGQYRVDLYYRIAGIDLRLPSLRERRIDVPALAESMLKRITEAGAPRCKLTDRALDKLMAYDFPGNVRELRNILLRAVAICNNSVIDAEQIVLGSSLNNAPQIDSPALSNSGTVQEMQKVVAGIPITQLESDYIAELLKIHHGHRRNVADILGMSERTLYRKLKQYGLS
jgi:DNA-binding NtrC family response regulator